MVNIVLVVLKLLSDVALTSPPGAKCSKSLSADMPLSLAFSKRVRQCNIGRTGESLFYVFLWVTVVVVSNKEVCDCRSERHPVDFRSCPWVYPLSPTQETRHTPLLRHFQTTSLSFLVRGKPYFVVRQVNERRATWCRAPPHASSERSEVQLPSLRDTPYTVRGLPKSS